MEVPRWLSSKKCFSPICILQFCVLVVRKDFTIRNKCVNGQSASSYHPLPQICVPPIFVPQIFVLVVATTSLFITVGNGDCRSTVCWDMVILILPIFVPQIFVLVVRNDFTIYYSRKWR
jgi:hypothetical protein